MYRRRFLATSATLVGSVLARSVLGADGLARTNRVLGPGGPDLRALAHVGLDAARGAGARYAEVLFRTTQLELWGEFGAVINRAAPNRAFAHGVGVRALVGGCWGMAATDGLVTADDVARLGRDAATQAAMADRAGARVAELAEMAPAAKGNWVTPIERDPFAVPADEKLDFVAAMCDDVARSRWDVDGEVKSHIWFQKVDTTMASTDGSDYAQTTYTTGGGFRLGARSDCRQGTPALGVAELLTPVGAGWEYVRTAPFRDSVAALLEVANRGRNPEPPELGWHDVVFDAYAMAALLSGTLGAATAVDRAMGLSSRGVGTSFLSDPLAMLGSLRVASPLVTITADRSMPRGAATVHWDDEGVRPAAATLVKDGVLTDFQTTRESAMWLAPYYARAGLPARSNGCAGRSRATAFPGQCLPNLTLAPATEALTFEDLVRSTSRGYAICGGRRPRMDWQALTGVGEVARMYRIRDGKLGRAVDTSGAYYLLRTPELWNSIVALGGQKSVRAFGLAFDGPDSSHTVVAVPAKVRRLRIMPPARGM